MGDGDEFQAVACEFCHLRFDSAPLGYEECRSVAVIAGPEWNICHICESRQEDIRSVGRTPDGNADDASLVAKIQHTWRQEAPGVVFEL